MQNTKEFEIKLYSTDDVCKLLHIGKQKCLKLFHSEEFPSIKVGRKFWVKADCLDEFLSQKRIMADWKNRRLNYATIKSSTTNRKYPVQKYC